MRIKSLELSGYKRLLLNNIQYLKLTPQDKLQIILGSNGAGKSSVIKELSPLPAVQQEFLKDGYKIIEIEHRSLHYKLSSLFLSTGNQFSFMVEGEELNRSYGITMYREFVKQHFNLTQDIFEVLLGKETFTLMNTAERKTWFTRISSADYTYAIRYYQKLREQLRDLQGAIKLSQSRLVQEVSKSLSEAEYEQLRTRISEGHQLIEGLISQKSPISRYPDDFQTHLKQLESVILEQSSKLIKAKQSIPNHEGFTSVEDIESVLIKTQSAISVAQHEANQHAKQIETHQSTLTSLMQSNIESLSDIDGQIAHLQEQIEMTQTGLSYPVRISQPVQALQAISSVQASLTQICTDMPANPDQSLGYHVYNQLLDQKHQAIKSVEAMDHQQYIDAIAKKELDHAKEHNQVECPKCQHLWALGYDEAKYQTLSKTLQDRADAILNLSNHIATLDVSLERNELYMSSTRDFKQLTSHWHMLDPLWQYIEQMDVLQTDPKKVLQIVEGVKEDMVIWAEIERLQEQCQSAESLRLMVTDDQNMNRAMIEVAIDQLQSQLYEINQTVQQQYKYSQLLQRYKAAYLTIVESTRVIAELEKDYTTSVDQLVETYRQMALSEVVNCIKYDIMQYEQQLSKVDIQKTLIATLEQQIAEMSDNVKVLKIAVKELSPEEGLIAKGLTGFIDHFVKQINAFIEQVWLYPLVLKPVMPEDLGAVELDYKFSVSINDNITVGDVKLCSSAMQEIINLAFRVVSMHYLGMMEFPLYLDEFAITMDQAHRVEAHRSIRQLIESTNFSQIFMISHYESSYSSFKNADINVLCAANLQLPKDIVFNRNLELK